MGNQKWNGAIPIFIINEEAKMMLIKGFISVVLFIEKIKNKIIENKKTLDANAWVKKYFREASDENKLLDFIVKGIKDNKLISSPIHTLNHDEEEILIIVPKNKVNKNNIL